MKGPNATLVPALIALAAILGLTACGSSDKLTQAQSQRAASQTVARKLGLLTQTFDGAAAEKLASEIRAELPGTGTTRQDQIELPRNTLENLVSYAWFSTAKDRLHALRELKNDPKKAEELRAAFYDAQKKSGHDLRDFGNTADGINRLVARNFHGAGNLQSSSPKQTATAGSMRRRSIHRRPRRT